MQGTLSQKLVSFLNEGFTQEDFGSIVCRQSVVLNLSFEKNICPKLCLLEGQDYPGQSLSKAEVLQLVTSYPTVLAISTANISVKLHYLVNNMGRDVHELLKCPAYLAYSLEQRIAPRWAYIKAIGANEHLRLGGIVSVTDAAFCKMLKVGVEDYQTFKASKVWTENTKE